MNHCLRAAFVLLALAFVANLTTVSTADSNGAPQSAVAQFLQDITKQEQIKATTKRVGEQLEGVLGEFDRNGITGEDVKVLRAIRGVLDRLSEKEMATVIEFLQQSRTAADPSVATRSATEAYAGQKTIVVQFQQLVLEYQRQQALYEISLRLKELATRQTANMWQGVALAKATEHKTSFGAFDENQRISLRYQQSEQNPLKDETAAILGRLERLAKEITDGAAADRAKTAAQQAKDGALMSSLAGASDELKEEKLRLLSAIGNEKNARDQMREVARLLILSPETTDALKQAILELGRAIDTQKNLATETAKVRRQDEADKRATDQAATVDDTDLIRRDIDALAPIASEYLRTATDKMQEARASLSADEDVKKRVQDAAPKQEEAVTQMQSARRALEEQLARAEQAREKPENNLAALRDLQQNVRDLIQKQETNKQETASTDRKQLPSKAPKQGELKDAAQDLQVRASKPSPEAAQSIGEAAAQMQKSQNSLAQEQNNAPAQQAAVDALQRAEQQLAQNIAELEQAEKDLAQIEEMLKRLVGIISDHQAVQFVTTQQALRAKPEPEPLKQAATAQTQLGKDTAMLQRDSEPLVPAASQHLTSAAEAMQMAKVDLEKAAPAAAQPRQDEALVALYHAKREFENRINELRDKLGLPPAQDMDTLAEAQRRIEEAQKKVSEALQQLQQAPPGLMEALQKQQQEIAESLRELREDGKPVPSLTRAEQAAGDAARQLKQSNLPGAVESMKAARKSIEQARQSRPAAADTARQTPALAELDEKQDKVQQAAEALLAVQQKASEQSMQAAAEALKDANKAIGPLAAGAMGQMPAGAQAALQSAQGSTAQGSAQASANQNSPAQQSATAAAQALAQAQGALALAQAGIGSEAAMAQKGDGNGEGQAKGKGQDGGKGKAEGEGRGESQANATGKGKGQPSSQGNGNKGNWDADGGDGSRNTVTGSSSFTRLPSRDRAALQQSQTEKYPQEYGPLVEQYLRNLSDQATDK